MLTGPPQISYEVMWMLMIEENTEGNVIEGIDDAEEFRDLVTVWFCVNKQSQS